MLPWSRPAPLLCACLLAAGPVQAADRTVYSNLCSDPQGGDIGGWRITVEHHGSRAAVLYEWTDEGPLMGPTLAQVLAYDRHDGSLSFRVKGVAAFSGHVTPSALDGTLRSLSRADSHPIHLAHKDAPWSVPCH